MTVGGVGVGASVTSSTRIGATMPARAAGALYDVVVDNPARPSSVLPSGWFADFLDVPQASPFHAPVETIVRDGITSGCGGGNYCPTASITRAQMAVFLLRAEHGAAYVPPPATGTIFADVARRRDFAADWIEQLYAEGITGGCATGPACRYCPNVPVTRGQMAVFLLKVYHGTGYAPPPATGRLPRRRRSRCRSRPGSRSSRGSRSPRLRRLRIYCPDNSVTRGQMAVFMAKTFHRPEAIRFLEQATWGPSDAEIGARARRRATCPGWPTQYALPASSYPPTRSTRSGRGDGTGSCDDTCRRDNYTTYPLQNRFFTNALYQPDQLRQRVVLGAPQDRRRLRRTRSPYPSQIAPVPAACSTRTRSATTATSSTT